MCCLYNPDFFPTARKVKTSGWLHVCRLCKGFFRLLFVCMINICRCCFSWDVLRENGLKKILLAIISGCTYVMITSSGISDVSLYPKLQAYISPRICIVDAGAYRCAAWRNCGTDLSADVSTVSLYDCSYDNCSIAFGIVRPVVDCKMHDIAHMPQRENESLLPYLSTDAAPVIAGHKG